MDVKIEEVSFYEVSTLKSAYRKERMRLTSDEGAIWLGAKLHGELVGVCAYLPTRLGVMCKSDLVLEQYRGLGIYRKLFKERMNRLKPLNPKKIYAYCTPNSVQMFFRNGFKEKRKIYSITLVEMKYPFRNEKIEFYDFCKCINGKVVHGPKEMIIHQFSYYMKAINNPGTVLFLLGKSGEKLQSHKGNGNCAIVFQKGHVKEYLPDVTYIEVENVNNAYREFINFYRNRFDIPVYAITGTCGKTTVKEMIAHILHEYSVVSTMRSRNTPHSNLHYLTEITEETDVAVYETPVNGPRLLEKTCDFFQPTIGIITNIGVDHLNLCGTVDNYIQAKGKMLKGLGHSGTLIINADDENTKKISLDKFKGKVVTFGIDSPADYKASHIKYEKDGMSFTLHLQHMKYDGFVPGYGVHEVYNALTAIAAAHQIGFGVREAIEQLRSFKNIEKHMETFVGYNEATIIDDTWNSNPTSVEAAVKTFHEMGVGKKKICVIGSMSFLGEKEAKIHEYVGKSVANYPVDTFIAYGKYAYEIAKGAKDVDAVGNVIVCHSVDELEEILLPQLNKETALLFKTSMKDRSLGPLLAKLRKR
ncbi:UDP-N-acetylmuramoyl-tripeptide--D-alanyl-D-alanine ligase [Evansella sp. AB-P1]|uniref:UDP-N-acetylmuramoyl-tripeptide--D-alanyl-D- alanine ligase n=1 Tax=Evansella sp. AB-P1 TaxID=3037653 RepID=UPI00241C7E41|nr:UDP-N-acetylmuramoyl-tripeptide--D-alanyl-D-alanine ligase [Evansella sp. AB-P1]MDG5788817.1 UDP-N-acetylmuramoyl-tripeptide--D-alanyl-D-alanine ligase [Evansella sp. AB-P1]